MEVPTGGPGVLDPGFSFHCDEMDSLPLNDSPDPTGRLVLCVVSQAGGLGREKAMLILNMP